MSGPACFVVQTRSAAPPERVFALLADASAWQEWAGPFVPRARWETGNSGGVGATRRLGLGPLFVREQVVVHEPPRAFSYLLLTGRRWHGYRADVRLVPAESGTEIQWRGRLTGPAARLLLPGFRLLVNSFAIRLARAAARS